MNTGKTISTADAVRHLIVCDTQFTWAGVTNLTLEQMMDLQARGWVVEGDDNEEFQLTVAGEAVVAMALQHGAPNTLADVQPGGAVRLGDGLPPCPFCGHSYFDQWPCEYIDASGANVVRCAHCHAAAPMKVWNSLAARPPADDLHDEIEDAPHSDGECENCGECSVITLCIGCKQPAQAVDHDLHQHLLDMLGAKDHEDAGRIIGKLHAQAVDLGQFRPMVEEFRRNWANYGRTMTAAGKDTSTARQNVDAADRLLAVIDKAVGNG